MITRNRGPVTFLFFLCVAGIVFGFGSGAFGEEVRTLSGITEPLSDVTLSLSVQGRISVIYFKEGKRVRKGQPILRLEKRFEELEAERRKLVWESKAELKSAEARVETLGSQLEATRRLFDATKSVSKEDLEKLELDYKLALADRERLETAEERERIEYEMALQKLRERTLYAPTGGVIVKLFLHRGESCEPNQPLVHLVDVSRCRLVCNVEEDVGRRLKVGQGVDLQVDTGSGSIPKKGTLVFVSPVVDPASGLMEVKAEFDNADGRVRPGVKGAIVLKGL